MHVRGGVHELLKSDGAKSFASAHGSVMKHNEEDNTSFHIHHTRLDGDTHANTKERDSGTLSDFVLTCRGLKSMHTTHIAMWQINFNFQR